jgi:hypothetical protein
MAGHVGQVCARSFQVGVVHGAGVAQLHGLGHRRGSCRVPHWVWIPALRCSIPLQACPLTGCTLSTTCDTGTTFTSSKHAHIQRRRSRLPRTRPVEASSRIPTRIPQGRPEKQYRNEGPSHKVYTDSTDPALRPAFLTVSPHGFQAVKVCNMTLTLHHSHARQPLPPPPVHGLFPAFHRW